MMENKGNIFFCGVGGQGVLLAGEIVARALLKAGKDVKKSEVHGMAQRGGPVIAQLRYGDKVYSPLIEHGKADMVVAFEMLEAVRSLPFLHEKSMVIVDDHKIMPLAVATGNAEYPGNVLDELATREINFMVVDAFEISREIGEVKAANMVMVGALSVFLPVTEDTFLTVIEEHIPERFLAVNVRAFQEGRSRAK